MPTGTIYGTIFPLDLLLNPPTSIMDDSGVGEGKTIYYACCIRINTFSPV